MIDPLWTQEAALAATNGRARGHWQAFDVAIDNRDVRPGDLFVALKGERTDGHRFVDAALEAGAAAAMVDADSEVAQRDLPLLVVPDTLTALGQLGVAARAGSPATRIAVTGSVGKTGTKEALRAAFERQARVHASPKSFNNYIGVPLSLARLPQDADFAVFELGMNHPGELTPLSDMVRPDIAVITTIQPAHTAFFESLEAVADAKAEIFHGMGAGGTAILNRDIPQFDRLADAAKDAGVERIVGFGADERADVRLLRHKLKDTCSCITADVCGQVMMLKIAQPGRHWIDNALAVLAAVEAAGGDLSMAGLALATLPAVGGRGRRESVAWPGGKVTLIDESYNASPAAMRAAIAVLGNMETAKRGRRIAVLGDMRELGTDSPGHHRDLAEPLRDAGVDCVFTVGEAMADLDAVLPGDMRAGHAATAGDIVPDLMAGLKAGDVVLVKGSNSIGLDKVVAALETAFPRSQEKQKEAVHAV